MSKTQTTKKRKRVFLEKTGNNIIIDSSVYENEVAEKRILEQTQNPAVAIDLILQKRIGEAFRNEDVPTPIKTHLTKLVNTELTKDTKNMPDKVKQKVKKIARKLKIGDKVYKYPTLEAYFPPV